MLNSRLLAANERADTVSGRTLPHARVPFKNSVAISVIQMPSPPRSIDAAEIHAAGNAAGAVPGELAGLFSSGAVERDLNARCCSGVGALLCNDRPRAWRQIGPDSEPQQTVQACARDGTRFSPMRRFEKV